MIKSKCTVLPRSKLSDYKVDQVLGVNLSFQTQGDILNK